MLKITQQDIHGISDTASLMDFLREKLALPIPDNLAFRDIVTRFSDWSLGLSGATADLILDCYELSVSAGEFSGIFLVRFKKHPRYAADAAGILRDICDAFDRLGRDPSRFWFLCADTNYRPFAFAYFGEATKNDWQSAELNILSWAKNRVSIRMDAEHEIPPHAASNVQEVEPPSEEEATAEQADTPVTPSVAPTSASAALLAKLDSAGTPLGSRWLFNRGYFESGCNVAFVIDASKREQLIGEDVRSGELIKPAIQEATIKKWRPNPILKYLIFIPSGEFRRWPWSGRSESEAEQIFAAEYPAIHAHLNGYRDKLKTRKSQGEFYWELPARDEYPNFSAAKIAYTIVDGNIQACYDTSGAFVLAHVCNMPTDDLSLLAILNSKLFSWYARTKFGWPSVRDMQTLLVADQTEAQKAAIAEYVQSILDKPDSHEVPAFEEEIDALVYELYGLSSAESALIDESR